MNQAVPDRAAADTVVPPARAPWQQRIVTPDSAHTRRAIAILLVLAMLVGLPLAVWLDLRHLSEVALRRQAQDVGAMINAVRGYYASNVVSRVKSVPGHVAVIADYQAVDGAIPIPATLSIELGNLIGASQGNIGYRFVSDEPFRGRAPHPLDAFEHGALTALRTRQIENADAAIFESTWTGNTNRMRMITPVRMTADCVACHNSDPRSLRRNWKVGDVRGIQEVIVTRPLFTGLQSFEFLLLYFAMTALACGWFVLQQRRQAKTIGQINQSLETSNEFLARLSQRISRYLSPQIFRSIFSGETDDTIHTERKKLSIFFSDIKDFTATTERLQPEETTALLNEYLTEMYAIALRHGGTIDKFVGDAVLIFFGDPESRGVAEDARACVRMALDMQGQLIVLNQLWQTRGVTRPFKVRMGIATGYCNVGNFGSAQRMDYTIIGAQVNLAARLQSIAEPGQVVVSYETYALVRDAVIATALEPVKMKGIAETIVPYHIDRAVGENAPLRHSSRGFDLYLDPKKIDDTARAQAHYALRAALRSLEQGGGKSGGA